MESLQPNSTQLNNHFEPSAMSLDPDPPTPAIQLPEHQPQSQQQQITQTDAEVLQNGNPLKQQQQLENPTVTSESDHPTTSNDTEKPQEEEDMEDDDNGDADDDDDFEEEEEDPPPKKQKQLSALTELLPPPLPATSATSTEDDTKTPPLLPAPLLTGTTAATVSVAKKKSKSKKNNNVWVTRSTRKGKKKTKLNNNNAQNTHAQDTVLITPVPRLQDKTDDSPDLTICLSKVYKAEKVELSEDRLSAGSTKGYRMVRATRGVCEGAWYFEIKVVSLGETGHTRLGWSNEKGDLQAPVGYDANSFGYRDIDGSKVHKALREKYGEEGYKEGDVIGFYINLPDGLKYTPKPPHLVWYKGQRYSCAPDSKEDPPKSIPGSEISFFKNGVFQGIAYKDLYGGRYYPAASMYTLPNQPNCTVKFNFGPRFECFPEDFGERPIPRPIFEVPYHGIENRVENSMSNENKN